jgi:type IV secretory pathway TraG/TraD family ATPase VirD4
MIIGEIDMSILFFLFAVLAIFYVLFSLLSNKSKNDLMDFESAYDSTIKSYNKRENLNSHCTFIGKSGAKKIYLPIDSSHIFVCGTTGSGKTVALSNFVESGVKEDLPMLIIDGKGDIGRNSLLDIVEKLKEHKKVYVIDLNNPLTSDSYNPFKNTSPTVIKDMLINLTEWSEEHYKLNAERYLQRLIDLMAKADITLSFQNIVNHIPVKKFLEISGNLVKMDIITKEEHLYNNGIAEESGRIMQGAAARFSVLIESELGNIFSEDGVDIYTALQEKAIIFFILNPLSYPEISPLIGNLIVIDSKKAISAIYRNNLGCILFLMDEINVYASKSLLDLINKSRSASVTCILATQSLSDLDASTSSGEYFKEQIIENCNNYIVLRQNSATNSEQWANIIGTRKAMDVSYQLQSDNSVTTGTGMGSAKIVREYLFHPDEIKNLERGKAILVNKDSGYKLMINVHKPF